MSTITVDPSRLEWLNRISLANGGHSSLEDGVCAMEAVAYLAAEPHSDKPDCVSPVIGEFCRVWNDNLPDGDRDTILKPVLLETLGTRTTEGDDQVRAWLAVDWLARTLVPALLRLTPELADHADTLEQLAPLVCNATAALARPALSAARSAADSAALSAADSAARSAARSAADSAALSAALSAADSAALSAARSAALSAARSAALSAALSAADSAAEKVFRPVVALLQASAQDLVKRMCAVGRAA